MNDSSITCGDPYILQCSILAVGGQGVVHKVRTTQTQKYFNNRANLRLDVPHIEQKGNSTLSHEPLIHLGIC